MHRLSRHHHHWQPRAYPRQFYHTSKTKLDLFVSSHENGQLPAEPPSNSLLSYAIAQALKNIMPSRIQDEYLVNFDNDGKGSATPNSDNNILGQGRFGTVRRCQEIATNRMRAVKTQYKSHARRDPETGEFYEIEAMRHLPKGQFELVKVFQTPLTLHLVCELLQGPNFFAYWDDTRAWKPVKNAREEAEVASFMLKLCLTLNECHVAGYSHNDVKFENFMFRQPPGTAAAAAAPTADGGGGGGGDELVLIDFGSARPMSGARQLKQLLGSPSYASPEVMREARFTPTSDSWSLGVMSFVMLTGHFPISDDDDDEEEEDEEGEEDNSPEDPYDVYFCPIEWRKISAEAQDFTRKLLKKLPQDRLTVGQALLHPYMQRAISASQPSSSPYSLY